jgi:hypothetical protein
MCGTPNTWAIRFACVPLPEPGAPTRMIAPVVFAALFAIPVACEVII